MRRKIETRAVEERKTDAATGVWQLFALDSGGRGLPLRDRESRVRRVRHEIQIKSKTAGSSHVATELNPTRELAFAVIKGTGAEPPVIGNAHFA